MLQPSTEQNRSFAEGAETGDQMQKQKSHTFKNGSGAKTKEVFMLLLFLINPDCGPGMVLKGDRIAALGLDVDGSYHESLCVARV